MKSQVMTLTRQFFSEEGDVVSVRGMGKFRFEGCGSRTRKNRITVTVSKYI